MGEVRDSGKGAAFAADIIGKTFNLPIAAYVRIDFRGFEKIIDAIGGVEIEVARAFTDPNYPDEQGGVISVSFEEGIQTMDGATALRYVRSRHGSNGEGSDFARAKRQQQLLLAVREKIFRLSTLLNPGKLRAIMNTLESHLSTNIPLGQIDDIYNIAQRTGEKNMHRHVIDASPDGVLREGKDGAGAYVLVPQDGNYATLAQYVNNLLSSEELRNESASLAILNGTNEQGLARAAANDLTALGIQVTVSANAPSRNWHETVLFDVSRGGYPRTLDTLIQKYNARVLTSAIPQEIIIAAAQGVLRDEHNPQPIDIILILGK